MPPLKVKEIGILPEGHARIVVMELDTFNLQFFTLPTVYSSRLEDFVRKISGGGGRYVLPLPLKREAQRLMKAAKISKDVESVILQASDRCHYVTT
eukprot:s1355_g8.t1